MNDFDNLTLLYKKKLIPYYGFSQSAISLLFLKYIRENEYATTFKEALSNNKLTKKIIYDLLNRIEVEHSILKNTLKCAISDLENNLNDINILNYLKTEFDTFEDNKKEDLIYKLLQFADKDKTRTNIYTTNISLIELINKILDVKNNETYMNTFSGYNLASININANKFLGYELVDSVRATSLMIFIFLNKENFNISSDDIYLREDIEKADKILTDGPWGLFPDKLKYQERSKISNKMEYHNIDITIKSLNDNGKAVIVVPNKLLTNDSYKDIRETLVKNKLLEGVVSIPLVSNVTSVNPYLLIISKKVNDTIYFVDGNNKDFYIKDRRICNLTKDGIDKIIYGLTNTTGYSLKVSINDLLIQDNISLLVNSYVKPSDNVQYDELDNIELKLKELYIKFNRLINK